MIAKLKSLKSASNSLRKSTKGSLTACHHCNTLYRFIAKIQSLDPTQTDIPWQPRSYTCKRPHKTAEGPPPPKRLISPLIVKSKDSGTHIDSSNHVQPTEPITSNSSTVPSSTTTTIPGMINYSSSSSEDNLSD